MKIKFCCEENVVDKVSIVVPVYNMGSSIEKAVDSLLKQDYSNLEIILVDDGSKDDSYKHCLDIAENNPIVQVYHTENRGSGPARNYGIEKATGRYIFFPDADDYLESNAISVMVEAMKTRECDLVVFGFKNVNTKGETVKIARYKNEICDARILRNSYSECMSALGKYGVQGAPWNKFFDLKVIKENNIVYPSLRRHQDEGFIGRYMCYSKRVRFIEDVLYTYYTNDLQREWKKYPTDYIDAVIGLYEVRKETILTWNLEDKITHDMVKREYICNCIKALELSFSPKFNFGIKQRKKWISDNISRTGLAELEIPDILGKYQKIVMKLINKEFEICLYFLLGFKVLVEKYRILNLVKK